MNPADAQIKAAIDAFDLDRARALVRDALRSSPTADTYYLASQVALSDEQRQSFLRQAVSLDPFHSAAQAALAGGAAPAPSPPPVYQPAAYTPPVGPGGYGQPQAATPAAPNPSANTQAVAGFIIGLCMLVAWFIPLCGLPLGLTGLVLSILGMRGVGSARTQATVGLVLSILGLLAAIGNAILGVMLATRSL